MAIVLKSNRTYTDRFGNTHGIFHGVIESININMKEKIFDVGVNLYANLTAYQNDYLNIDSKIFSMTKDEFNTLVTIPNMNNYDNIVTFSYAHVLTKLTNWEED